MLLKHRASFRLFIPLLLPGLLPAQQSGDLQQILERLDRLEQENRNLTAEVHALREELAASKSQAPAAEATPESPPSPSSPIQQRMAVQESRTEELQQTKVEAAQRLPVTLSGTLLFNAFLNGRSTGGQQDPTIASLSDTTPNGGASLSQSVIGLAFNGPRIFGGGKVTGEAYMDLWGGSSNSLNHLVRLRVAAVNLDWKNQSIRFGQDKPIISPREPESLAQVAVSPLTSAGNLWLWQPQIRFEQRFGFGENAGLRAQAGVYQTNEPVASGGEYQSLVSSSRPGLEGRFEFWGNPGNNARIELAPGFHISQSHIAGVSVPSRLFSFDWLIQPAAKLVFTGMFFQGENAAGLGGLRQGFTNAGGVFRSVGAAGGWAQLSVLPTGRLSFNLYGGQESNRAADLLGGQINRNFAYAANGIYRLGPNVRIALEAEQARTKYLGIGNRLTNHYDLALGYLF
jgi:hypothetical protein